jgi:hypothetical protein
VNEIPVLSMQVLRLSRQIFLRLVVSVLSPCSPVGNTDVSGKHAAPALRTEGNEPKLMLK